MHAHLTRPERVPRPEYWERVAMVAGLLAVAAQLAAFAYFGLTLAGDLPPLDAPAAEHAAYYARYVKENALGNYLFILPTPFFLVFAGGLLAQLRRREQEAILSFTAFGAAVAYAMVFPIGILGGYLRDELAEARADAVVTKAADSLPQLALALSGFPLSVFLATASLVLLAARVTPRWIGWLGLLAAGIAFAATVGLLVPELIALAFLMLLLTHGWIAAVSLTLLRRGAR